MNYPCITYLRKAYSVNARTFLKLILIIVISCSHSKAYGKIDNRTSCILKFDSVTNHISNKLVGLSYKEKIKSLNSLYSNSENEFEQRIIRLQKVKAFLKIQQIDKALFELNNLILNKSRQNNKKESAYISYYLGEIAYHKTNSDSVLYYYSEAAREFKQLENNDAYIICHLKIATHFSILNNNSIAFNHYYIAKSHFPKSNNKRLKYSVLSNMANLFFESNQLDSAIHIYNELEKTHENIISVSKKSRLYNNISAIHIKNEDWNNANSYLQKSLLIKRNLNDTIGIQSSLQNLFKVAIETKNIQMAENYHNQISNLFSSASIPSDVQIDFLYNCIDFYYLINDIEKANNCFKLYDNLKDSLSNLAFSDKLIEIQKSFEIQDRDKEIDLLQKEDELKEAKLHNQLLVIISIASTLLIILVLGYFINRQRFRLKKSEKRLNLQKKEISDVNEALKLSNLSKDKLLSVIGHDLRGPVGGLKELIELYMDLPNYEANDIENLLKAARESSTSTYHLLENLLSWANSQRGEIDYNPVATPLLPLVKQTVGILDSSINTRKIAFEYQIDLQIVVDSDMNMLRTIIRNLVSNAVKYSPPESTITLSANVNSKETLICISDKGYGMSAEEIQQLFEKKETYFIESGPNAKGSGLGLILCKEFVEKHEGRIWVESEKNQGTKVCFTLPNNETYQTLDKAITSDKELV